MEGRNVIFYFAIKYKGDWDKIYEAIATRESLDMDLYKKYKETVNEKFITLLDNEYPDVLKPIYKAPLILFYRGDISLIKEKNTLSVIGTRKNSMYGKNSTELLLSGLNKDIVIISGLAKGIDGIAHNAALKNGLKTIAILGSGINVCYPTENFDLFKKIEAEGLILSEYPPNVEPNKDNFPFRNRIIAALGKVILVTEAKERSGTSITVSFGLTFNKTIYAVPDRIGSNNYSFCNDLIREGAFLVRNSQDLNEEFK